MFILTDLVSLKKDYAYKKVPNSDVLLISDSETTDPVSLEDTSDDDNSGPSGPSTPLEDLPKPATRVYL